MSDSSPVHEFNTTLYQRLTDTRIKAPMPEMELYRNLCRTAKIAKFHLATAIESGTIQTLTWTSNNGDFHVTLVFKPLWGTDHVEFHGIRTEVNSITSTTNVEFLEPHQRIEEVCKWFWGFLLKGSETFDDECKPELMDMA